MKFKKVVLHIEYIVPNDEEAIELASDWIYEDMRVALSGSTDADGYLTVKQAKNATLADVDPALIDNLTMECKFCHKEKSKYTGTFTTTGYVCEDCWDERLRITE